jgi:hypothetical protein
MDIRKCSVCKSKFDFDEAGFQQENGRKKGGKVVCSEACANTFATQRGTPVVIKNKHGAVIATNGEPGGALRPYGH